MHVVVPKIVRGFVVRDIVLPQYPHYFFQGLCWYSMDGRYRFFKVCTLQIILSDEYHIEMLHTDVG